MKNTYTLEQLQKMIDREGWLDLRGTSITALPENLTVGGSLYLSGTSITALPDNLTVGGWLDLSGTSITALPENLTVGGWLYLRGTSITQAQANKVKRLKNGDMVEGKWIYCDGILTHIVRTKKCGKYTFYIGKIKTQNVVTDGKLYAHCKTFKQGVLDLEFKACKERGATQYEGLTIDSELAYDEAIVCYRVITGACSAGTQQFIDNLHDVKDKYTVREIIELTKGQYGATTFAEFFEKKDEE